MIQSGPPSIVLREKAADVRIGDAIAGFVGCVADDVICLRYDKNMSNWMRSHTVSFRFFTIPHRLVCCARGIISRCAY